MFYFILTHVYTADAGEHQGEQVRGNIQHARCTELLREVDRKWGNDCGKY